MRCMLACRELGVHRSTYTGCVSIKEMGQDQRGVPDNGACDAAERVTIAGAAADVGKARRTWCTRTPGSSAKLCCSQIVRLVSLKSITLQLMRLLIHEAKPGQVVGKLLNQRREYPQT